MFRKLVKYEWSAMIRSMMPIYGAAIAVSVLNSLFLNMFVEGDGPIARFWQWLTTYFGGIVVFLYIAVLMALGAYTCVITIQRFYKGLLGQEGYLMFTLPVKNWQLVFSKALVSFLIGMLSVAVSIICIGALGGFQFLEALVMAPGVIRDLLVQAFTYDQNFSTQIILFCMELLLAFIIAYFASIYHVYFAVSLGHMAKNHRAFLSVFWYIVITSVLGFLTVTGIDKFSIFMDRFRFPYGGIHVLGISMILSQLAEAALLALGTGWILKRKLNLE